MFRKDEKAVSPVIGVILMVAITVILAAVIASFVFGMGSSVKKQYTVSVTAAQDGDNLSVTIQGGPDIQSLVAMKVTVTNSSETNYFWANASSDYLAPNSDDPTDWGNVTDSDKPSWYDSASTAFSVGKVLKTQLGIMTSERDHVVIVGRFADGTEQVLLDTYL